MWVSTGRGVQPSKFILSFAMACKNCSIYDKYFKVDTISKSVGFQAEKIIKAFTSQAEQYLDKGISNTDIELERDVTDLITKKLKSALEIQKGLGSIITTSVVFEVIKKISERLEEIFQSDLRAGKEKDIKIREAAYDLLQRASFTVGNKLKEPEARLRNFG